MPTLVVTDVKKNKTREVPIRDSKFTIGSKDSNHLVLPRSNIAPHHCVIYYRDEQFYCRDLSNGEGGTVVDGSRVARDVVLDSGSRIEIGDFDMVFKSKRTKRGGASTTGGRSRDRAAEDEDEVVRRRSRDIHSQPLEDSDQEPEPVRAPRPAVTQDRKEAARERPQRFEAEQKWRSRDSRRPDEDAVDDDQRAARTHVKKKIHAALLESRDMKSIDLDNLSEEEGRERVEKVVIAIVKDINRTEAIPSFINKRELVKDIVDEALGLGPLEDLIADDSINEIMVNRWDRIYVEKAGHGMVLTDKSFSDDAQVVHVIRRIISPLGRIVNEQTPLVDARLRDGSRVNAIIPPLAVSGPSLTIRKFSKKSFDVGDLVNFGSMTPQMGDFLEIAVRERMNICISGGTGSGKTTLLNVVSSFIPNHERIVTVEDVSELKLPQDHVVTLEAKAPNLEGKGAIPIQKLVINCLRMRPDRIVVGECRGGEALDMLQAMNTGHDGSLTTIHSNSPRDCIARMETLVLMSGMDLPARAIREQIAAAIHVIIQQARLADGTRKVTHITEVCGMEGNTVTLQDIFLFKQTGFTQDGKVEGYFTATGNIPTFVHELRRRGIRVDMSIFQPTEGADVDDF